MAFFSPPLAHAELSDISRIFRQTPTISQFEICQGGGYTLASKTSLTELEWNSVARIFNETALNAQENNEVVERQKSP